MCRGSINKVVKKREGVAWIDGEERDSLSSVGQEVAAWLQQT